MTIDYSNTISNLKTKATRQEAALRETQQQILMFQALHDGKDPRQLELPAKTDTKK